MEMSVVSEVPNGKSGKDDETVPLNVTPGLGAEVRRSAPGKLLKEYRILAIASIVCGLSCLGMVALINSVKVRECRATDPERAQRCSRRARKYSLLAIGLWVGLLILVPTLMALVSYLLTLQN
ncbi:transmembrane protein 265 [Amia ocellicauda]|uniref:transmembrane protein 265 n=1 Tax=Amia ocellicauda TaxID=2972642 RepID=UPI0034644966